MKVVLFMRIFALVALSSWILSSQAFGAAAPSPALMKAKQDAEAKGFAFETSRDEIIAKAKKEGRLRALSSLDPGSFKPMADSFKKKYPSIDIQIHELTGHRSDPAPLVGDEGGHGQGLGRRSCLGRFLQRLCRRSDED